MELLLILFFLAIPTLWLTSLYLVRNTKSGKRVYFFNIVFFVIYTLTLFYLLPNKFYEGGAGLGPALIWLGVLGIHSIAILIQAIIYNRRLNFIDTNKTTTAN